MDAANARDHTEELVEEEHDRLRKDLEHGVHGEGPSPDPGTKPNAP